VSAPGRLLRRGAGALSRRLDRPELLLAVDPLARRAEREEVGIRAVLASSLASDSVYVDVGSNRGQVLREAVRVAPAARHIAFEPIPELARDLAREFPGVDCRTLAVGARREQASFCHFRTMDGWSGLRRSPEVSDARGHPEYIQVEVSTLDEELAGAHPRVVKIDVEGAELAALQGATTLLSDERPLVILEHVASAAALYGSSSADVWRLLRELDYDVFAITGEGPFEEREFATASTIVNWLARPRTAGGQS
jgi:FkbM family methyltransferase